MRPWASQSLLKELNAESSCVDRLLMGSPAVSFLVLSLLLLLFLLPTEEGWLDGAASLALLPEDRFNGNERGNDGGLIFSVPA